MTTCIYGQHPGSGGSGVISFAVNDPANQMVGRPRWFFPQLLPGSIETVASSSGLGGVAVGAMDSGSGEPDKKKRAKAEGKVDETHWPVHATLEEAMIAAIVCKKCVPAQRGTKGCRACMGEFFEAIRKGKARGT